MTSKVTEQLKQLGLTRKMLPVQRGTPLADGKRIFVNKVEYYSDDALPAD